MTSDPQVDLSPISRAALKHLHRLCPLDGYGIDRYLSTSGKNLLRLKRRNVPLHEEGFIEIVHVITHGEAAGCIVGIQVLTSQRDVGRGIVLVDKDGKISRDATRQQSVLVSMANVETKVDRESSNTIHHDRQSLPTPMFSGVTDNQHLLQYAVLILGALLLLKVILASISNNLLSILLFSLLYYYSCRNCPSNSSFDPKKELKRVLRGAHLPSESQPQGILERGWNRLAASIGTELATSLGYETKIEEYGGGAGKLAFVRVPVAGMDFYWVGLWGECRT